MNEPTRHFLRTIMQRHLISATRNSTAVTSNRKFGVSRLLTFAAVAIVLTVGTFDSAAQTSVQVVTKGSSVSIDGSSNVNNFTCVATEVEGSGEIGTDEGSADPIGRVEIPVAAFDCENARMNRDLFDALKGHEHPSIAYRLEDVRVIDNELDNGAALLEAEGTIWVAGVGRSIRTRVVGDRLANGYLRATGTLNLSMADFSIEPPSAVLGLVRVRDAIQVSFEITAEPATSTSNDMNRSADQLKNLLGAAMR